MKRLEEKERERKREKRDERKKMKNSLEKFSDGESNEKKG